MKYETHMIPEDFDQDLEIPTQSKKLKSQYSFHPGYPIQPKYLCVAEPEPYKTKKEKEIKDQQKKLNKINQKKEKELKLLWERQMPPTLAQRMEQLLVNVLGSPIFDPVKMNITYEDTENIESYSEDCVKNLFHDLYLSTKEVLKDEIISQINAVKIENEEIVKWNFSLSLQIVILPQQIVSEMIVKIEQDNKEPMTTQYLQPYQYEKSFECENYIRGCIIGYIYVMKEIALKVFKFRSDQAIRVPDYIRGLKKIMRKKTASINCDTIEIQVPEPEGYLKIQ